MHFKIYVILFVPVNSICI